MKGNAEWALALVMASEGGCVDDPADPGGCTHFGITQMTLSEVRGHPVSRSDVLALTVSEATSIYRTRYWDKMRADDLPSGLDYVVFDASVNSGFKQASLWLQSALEAPRDGVIGPMTLALAEKADVSRVIQTYCDLRLAALRKLPTFNRFGRGWESRVERVRRDALAFAHHSAPSPPPLQKELITMEQTQSIFQSRTVWSNIIGFGAFILSLTGHGASLDTGQLTDSIMQVITAGSFVSSTLFRILSTKKVAV